jgi:hypothetical protein
MIIAGKYQELIPYYHDYSTAIQGTNPRGTVCIALYSVHKVSIWGKSKVGGGLNFPREISAIAGYRERLMYIYIETFNFLHHPAIIPPIL